MLKSRQLRPDERAVRIDALSTAISGIRSAQQRIGVAAHNLANLATADFRPLEARQSALRTGGSEVEIRQAAEPRTVAIEDEIIEMAVSGLQLRASMRVIETELDLLGQLLDVNA